jgi:hypothetical protein
MMGISYTSLHSWISVVEFLVRASFTSTRGTLLEVLLAARALGATLIKWGYSYTESASLPAESGYWRFYLQSSPIGAYPYLFAVTRGIFHSFRFWSFSTIFRSSPSAIRNSQQIPDTPNTMEFHTWQIFHSTSSD